MKHYQRPSYLIEKLKFTLVVVGIGGLILLANECAGQTYHVGATTAAGYTVKMNMQIIVGDSTLTIKGGGAEQSRKITNKTDVAIYVTDGTATDRYTISKLPGKIKGFAYTHVLGFEADKRFSSAQSIIYYCILKP